MSIKKTVEGTMRTLHQHGMRLTYSPWAANHYMVRDSQSTMGWHIPARVARAVIKQPNVEQVRTWVVDLRGKDGRMHKHTCCEYRLVRSSK